MGITWSHAALNDALHGIGSVATWHKIFTTADAGQTWTALLPAGYIDPRNQNFDNISALAAGPQHEGTTFVVGYAGLLKSTEGGANRRTLDFGCPPFAAFPNALLTTCAIPTCCTSLLSGRI